MGTDVPGRVERTSAGGWSITATRTYEMEIVAEPGVVFETDRLARLAETGRAFVVLDEGIDEHYRERIEGYFDARDITVQPYLVPSGENAKAPEVALLMHQELLTWGIDRRREPVLAFGGGATLDLTGKVASEHLRGVPWAAVPFSALAMLDTALGLKVGVNVETPHGLRKNKLGAFHPAAWRFIDVTLLRTLPDPMLTEGLLELTKAALMLDHSLAERLYEGANGLRCDRFADDAGLELMRDGIDATLAGLMCDPFEDDLARLLDFGHTLAHAFEETARGGMRHGIAVGHDMAVSMMIALNRGMIDEDAALWQLDLLRRVGLPHLHTEAVSVGVVGDALYDRTRHRGGRLRMVVPSLRCPPAEFLDDVEITEVLDAADALRSLDRAARS